MTNVHRGVSVDSQLLCHTWRVLVAVPGRPESRSWEVGCEDRMGSFALQSSQSVSSRFIKDLVSTNEVRRMEGDTWDWPLAHTCPHGCVHTQQNCCRSLYTLLICILKIWLVYVLICSLYECIKQFSHKKYIVAHKRFFKAFLFREPLNLSLSLGNQRLMQS